LPVIILRSKFERCTAKIIVATPQRMSRIPMAVTNVPPFSKLRAIL
jgi:hypothetical protein